MWVACCVTTPAACVSVRSERLGITGPWGRRRRGTCSPARWRERTVETQECTQIGENGLSAPFRGICVHCCDARLRRVARADGGGRRSVHRLAKMVSRRRSGAFVYTVASRGSHERPWGRRSVHRLAKMGSRRRFGAFVYTVATRFVYTVATPDCVGWRERRRREVGVFTEASTHTNPEESESNQCFFVGEERDDR